MERGYLDDLISRYPWFATGRLLRDSGDPELVLHIQAWGRPRVRDVSVAPCEPDPIDRFLARGEYRILPGESDEDAAARSAEFVPDIVSEQLAEIYLAQGLNEQAKVIYERLSLLNPEKSVYFAELISKCN